MISIIFFTARNNNLELISAQKKRVFRNVFTSSFRFHEIFREGGPSEDTEPRARASFGSATFAKHHQRNFASSKNISS